MIHKKEFDQMAPFFLKRYFDNIPMIPCTLIGERNFTKGEDGKFIIEENATYNEENDDLIDSPEYNKRWNIAEGFGVDYGLASWTDPLNHPNMYIQINLKYANDPLRLVGILLHELTHYWCWYCGYDYRDGNKEFETKLKELGLPSNLDYGFNKEIKKYEDVFDYTRMQKYYDEFRASLLDETERERQKELMEDLLMEQKEQMG